MLSGRAGEKQAAAYLVSQCGYPFVGMSRETTYCLYLTSPRMSGPVLSFAPPEARPAGGELCPSQGAAAPSRGVCPCPSGKGCTESLSLLQCFRDEGAQGFCTFPVNSVPS